MAANTILNDVLDKEEIQNLPQVVFKKLQEYIELQKQNVEALREENAQLTARTERSEFELDKTVTESQKQIAASENLVERLRKESLDLVEKLNAHEKEVRELKSTVDLTGSDLKFLKKTNEQLMKEKTELLESAERKRQEIDRLSGDLKKITEQLVESSQNHQEAVIKLEEWHLKEVTFQHQEKRFLQEKELLQKQLKDFTDDLHERTQEVTRLRREKSSIVCDLQADLDIQKERVRVLEGQLESYKTSVQEKDQRIETLARRVKELQDGNLKLEEHFQQEIKAQCRLVELYKRSAEESDSKIKELVSTVEEMQKVLQEQMESKNRLEESFNESQRRIDEVSHEKDDIIMQLKEEIQTANQMLSKSKGATEEDIERLFPAAMATSKALRSGMTLTQIVNDHFKLEEDFVKVKNENEQLKQQLTVVVSEIEENAPVVNKHFQEYQKALENISCLREQLADSVYEQEKLLAERDDVVRINSQTERENKKLKQQCDDLSRQVCQLLKEVEEARGGFVTHARDDQENVISSTDGTSAESIISKHLVTFKSIEDLQQKNKEILAVVRDLSARQEELEKKSAEDRTAELNVNLEKATAEIEQLKEDNSRRLELVKSLARQRDMYKILLQQQDVPVHSIFDPSLTSTPALSKPIESKLTSSQDDNAVSEARAALQQLKQEFDTYRTEKAENTRMMSEQLEKLRDDLMEQKIQNTKLSSEVEYAHERFNMVQTNMENFKKEASALRERNMQLSNTVVQHQQTINTLRQDLMSGQEKLASTEVALENVKKEKDLFKNTELRLVQEKECLLREQQSQAKVLANLQAVQNNLERLECETRQSLKNQVEKYEMECSSLRSQLEAQSEQHRSVVEVWEKQVKELNEKLTKESEKSKKAHEELIDAYAQVHELRQQVSEAESKYSSLQNQLPKTDEKSGTFETKALREQLSKANSEIKALKEQLSTSQRSLEYFKTVAGDVEARLKEQNEAGDHYKEIMENAMRDSAELRKRLDSRIETLEKQGRDLMNENVRVTEESSSQARELQRKLTSLERELEELRSKAESSEKREETVRMDQRSQNTVIQEVQDKYERELMLHAADVEALNTLRQQLSELQPKLNCFEEAARKAEDTLNQHKASWSEREKMLNSEQEALRKQIIELQTQNGLLHEQLEKVTSEMASLQTRNWASVTPEENTKSTEQLMEVIKYLRREKEIAISQNDVVQAENVRLKVQVDHQSKQLEELQKDLKEERDRALAKASSDVQHSELLRKVEMVNIVTESNRLLRDENEALKNANKQLSVKLSQLEKEIAPIQEKVHYQANQIDTLQNDNTALRTELKRWQARTNQLLEQSNRTDPEDFKRAIEENNQMKQKVNSLNEEIQTLRSQLSRMGEDNKEKKTAIDLMVEEAKKLRSEASLVPRLRAEVLSCRSELDSIKPELENCKKEIQIMNLDKEEKIKTIVQVKKIARRYRGQSEELTAANEKLETEVTDLKKQIESSIPDPAAIATAQEAARQEVRQEVEQEIKDLKETEQSLREELENIKKESTTVASEKQQTEASLQEQQEKNKQLSLTARKKINHLTSKNENLQKEFDALNKENEELKQKVLALEAAKEEVVLRENTIKSQFERRNALLEKEIKELKEVFEKSRESFQMAQKLAQKPTKPSTAAGPVERSSGSPGEPLTANIRPLTPPSVQPSTSGLRHTPHPTMTTSKPTPTASIRPMAIAGTSSSSQARLVAVPPTTAVGLSSVEEQVLSTPATPVALASPVPQAAVHPTPAVPTSATANTATVAPTSVTEMPSAAVSPTVISESSPQQAEGVVQPVTPPSASVPVTAVVVPHVECPDEETGEVSAEVPVTSVQTLFVIPGNKRQREDESVPSSESEPTQSTSQIKRVKIVSEPERTEEGDEDISSSGVAGSSHKDQEVIVVESDDSNDIEIPSQGEEDDDENKEMSSGDEVDDDDEKRIDEVNDEENEAEVEMEVPQEDVEILELPHEESQDNEMAESDDSRPQPSGIGHDTSVHTVRVTPAGTESVVPGHHVPPPPLIRQPVRTERLPSGLPFDEEYEGIVPSTPTLYMPATRSEPFGEPASSPHVPQVQSRFVYSQDVVPQTSGVSQLERQGDVESTTMDLSNFDNGGGRSVPSTPLQVSPPESRDASLFPSDPTISEVSEVSGHDDVLTQTTQLISTSAESAFETPSELPMETPVEISKAVEVTEEGETSQAQVQPSPVIVEEPSESGQEQEEGEQGGDDKFLEEKSDSQDDVEPEESQDDGQPDSSSGTAETAASGSSQVETSQQRRQRIVWREQEATSSSSTPLPVPPATGPRFAGPTSRGGSSLSVRYPETVSRGGRRVRLRPTSTTPGRVPRGGSNAAWGGSTTTWRPPRGGSSSRPPRGHHF